MHLTDEQISEYQELYKNRFGKELSREEAFEQGIKLVRLIEIIYKPITKKEFENLQIRRKQMKGIGRKFDKQV